MIDFGYINRYNTSMQLNTVTKHEQCQVTVVDALPHAGKLVCIDPKFKHKRKHIKWVSAWERAEIERIQDLD